MKRENIGSTDDVVVKRVNIDAGAQRRSSQTQDLSKQSPDRTMRSPIVSQHLLLTSTEEDGAERSDEKRRSCHLTSHNNKTCLTQNNEGHSRIWKRGAERKRCRATCPSKLYSWWMVSLFLRMRWMQVCLPVWWTWVEQRYEEVEIEEDRLKSGNIYGTMVSNSFLHLITLNLHFKVVEV